MIVTFLRRSVESCVSTSKLRMPSTSSPKNSKRYGSLFEKEYTSTIPPLTENSPGSVTKSTLLNLYSNKVSFKKSMDSLSFKLIFKVLRSRSEERRVGKRIDHDGR